jgi:hypothetical protein
MSGSGWFYEINTFIKLLGIYIVRCNGGREGFQGFCHIGLEFYR